MNTFEVNDLSIGLDYLPERLARKVNKNICNGGGGSSSQTTRSELDPDIKKAILPAIQDASNQYTAGDFEKVAGQVGVKSALGQQEQLAQKSLDEGLGTENLLNQLRANEGAAQAAQQGALGSARADRAREAGLTDQAMQLQQADLAVKQQGAGALGQIAGQGRSLEQEQLDSGIKGAERYFGLMSSAPQGNTTTTSGGGGK